MIPPQVLAAGGALALIAGFLGGWMVRDWKADAEALRAVEKAEKLRDQMQARTDDKASQLEAILSENRQAATVTQTKLREIYRDVQVPSDCAAPAAAGSVLDDAIARANAEVAGQSGTALPAPAASAGAADRP
jgi:hypothetical protein